MSLHTLPNPETLAPESKPLRFFHTIEIPEEEVPHDCAYGMSSCADLASVWVTSNYTPSRAAMCLLHANLCHAEWLVNL